MQHSDATYPLIFGSLRIGALVACHTQSRDPLAISVTVRQLGLREGDEVSITVNDALLYEVSLVSDGSAV